MKKVCRINSVFIIKEKSKCSSIPYSFTLETELRFSLNLGSGIENLIVPVVAVTIFNIYSP